jgi:hypothetical protein
MANAMIFPKTEQEKKELIERFERLPMRLLRMHRDHGREDYDHCGDCFYIESDTSGRVFHCNLFEKNYNARGFEPLRWIKKWPGCGAFLKCQK